MSSNVLIDNPEPPMAGRVVGQGALLFFGFGISQLISLVRNGIIGHWLSPTDFGIAAVITLILQLTETLSDLGSDRLIIQAEDGASRRFVASAHAMLLVRGVLMTALLWFVSPTIAALFAIPHALPALQIAALVPLIKGFTHLDLRIAQRRLDNMPQLLVEFAPQVVALGFVYAVLKATNDFEAVAWLAILQSVAIVVTSHLLARTRYEVAIDRALAYRHIAFGWPVLASALPLVAVYQGERLMIGQTLGVEMLAAFSVAFTVTMVPGLIAAKVGHALMLPLFASALRARDNTPDRFHTIFLQATEATNTLAAVYIAVFAILGGTVIPIVFGPHYSGLQSLATILALMWALRMVQAVPGMALMAHGETKPFLVAGIIRAHALPVAYFAAIAGANLTTLALVGLIFECLSLLYVAVRIRTLGHGLTMALLRRTTILIPISACAISIGIAADGSLPRQAIIAALAALLTAAICAAVFPRVRALIEPYALGFSRRFSAARSSAAP